MKLKVEHDTFYLYQSPVTRNFNEVRKRPVTDACQTVESFVLTVNPIVPMQHYHDFYLNSVDAFQIDAAHGSMGILAVSTVDRQSPYALAGDPAGVSMRELALCEDLDECWDFLASSQYVSIARSVWRLALDMKPESDDVFLTAEAISRGLYELFEYDPGATAVHTHMEEAVELRRGVCQDYAHVFIGMCRALRIPARYVSGYLYDAHNDGLRGRQATHAWGEVFVPHRGWFGLDPTNNKRVDDCYVRVALGRDYDDVAPVKGSYLGTVGESPKLEVKVNVEAVFEPQAAV